MIVESPRSVTRSDCGHERVSRGHLKAGPQRRTFRRKRSYEVARLVHSQ
jgi:hypothetical protein